MGRLSIEADQAGGSPLLSKLPPFIPRVTFMVWNALVSQLWSAFMADSKLLKACRPQQAGYSVPAKSGKV